DRLDKLAANGHFLVPTITGCYMMAGLGEVIDPEGAEAHSEMLPMLVDLAVYNLEETSKSVRAARAAGVKIALGTAGPTRAGWTSLELLRMIHHGLTAQEALVAATRTAAEALGIDEHVGTVASGKVADLVVVEGDPVAEPELLRDP